MVTVHLWGALRPALGGAASVELDAANIRDLFQQLENQYPKTLPFIEEGIAVSVDGIIYQDSWLKELPPGAEIYLLPRIAGG